MNQLNDLILKTCQHGINPYLQYCSACGLQKEINNLRDCYTGLAHEIKFLMEERDKGIERIKLLEESDGVKEGFIKEFWSKLKIIDDKIDNLEKYAHGSPTSKVEEYKNNLTFGEAIEKLKQGKKIGCWDTNDRYLFLHEHNKIFIQFNAEKWYLWIINHEEILAENWRVIE